MQLMGNVMSKGNRIRAVRDTGIKIEANHKFHKSLVDPGPGKHFWVVTGLWTVSNPSSEQFILDVENLVTVDGPGCFKCEELYTDVIASQPCKGSMDL